MVNGRSGFQALKPISCLILGSLGLPGLVPSGGWRKPVRFTGEYVGWQKEHWIRGQETYFGQPWAGPCPLRASVPLGRGGCSAGWFLKTADLTLGLRLD